MTGFYHVQVVSGPDGRPRQALPLVSFPRAPAVAGLMTHAVAEGNRIMVRELQEGRSQLQPCPTDRTTAVAAVRGGDPTILRYLAARGLLKQQPAACTEAAASNKMAVLRQLREWQVPWNAETATAAAGTGNLAMLQWITGQESAPKLKSGACKAAAAGGHFHVLQWLRARTPPAPWGADALAAAARDGHLVMVRWMLQRGCPRSSDAVLAAAAAGSLPMLQALRNTHQPCKLHPTAMKLAAQNAHQETMRELQAQDCPVDWHNATLACLENTPAPDQADASQAAAHLQALEMLLRWWPHAQLDTGRADCTFCTVAAERGLVHQLSALRSHGFQWDAGTFERGSRCGHRPTILFMCDEDGGEPFPRRVIHQDAEFQEVFLMADAGWDPSPGLRGPVKFRRQDCVRVLHGGYRSLSRAILADPAHKTCLGSLPPDLFRNITRRTHMAGPT